MKEPKKGMYVWSSDAIEKLQLEDKNRRGRRQGSACKRQRHRP